MTDFWIYFENGFRHVLNIFACKHILLLIALTAPYVFKDWKKLLLLVSTFTFGNLIALLLSFFGVIIIKGNIIHFLSPVIILLVALFNIFGAKKSSKQGSLNLFGLITVLIGIIHGLGFYHYFDSITKASFLSKSVSALEFSLGIEIAQIIIVLLILLFSYIFQSIFRFSKRDWILMLSSFIIGVVLPMIINNEIWKRLY
ncbi:HupE/UreJ family protein [Flavobacterium sp.]|uniref:HupE/UreJ family protein n=1 Tax=Flavobacterium sp. TaxID=239 RepID=UPI0038FCC4DA